MFTFIIIIIVLVALFGLFKSLTKEEREVFAKGAANTIGVTAVYATKVGKETIKGSYNVGSMAGSYVSLEGQETINSIDEFNKHVTAEGGSTKLALRKAKEHGEALGLTDALDHIATLKSEVEAELAKARASRQ